jgi:hypothetical protein
VPAAVHGFGCADGALIHQRHIKNVVVGGAMPDIGDLTGGTNNLFRQQESGIAPPTTTFFM